MFRLDSAEKRLHHALSRLETAVETRMGDARAMTETELHAKIADLEAERSSMAQRMETAAVRIDVTVQRLRDSLGE
ncbi:MAG: DUF4164 family protein [Pseudomonadota bacterium]|nr:DUF4164 family protein [Pseudomonadota bacterium]